MLGGVVPCWTVWKKKMTGQQPLNFNKRERHVWNNLQEQKQTSQTHRALFTVGGGSVPELSTHAVKTRESVTTMAVGKGRI